MLFSVNLCRQGTDPHLLLSVRIVAAADMLVRVWLASAMFKSAISVEVCSESRLWSEHWGASHQMASYTAAGSVEEPASPAP